MKLRILSDLHLEFHRDGGNTFAAGQSDDGYDVLVLAGDITTTIQLRSALVAFKKAAGSRPIVYVPGNHEFYGSGPDAVFEVLDACKADNRNLHVIDNDSVVLDGRRFIGSTLWFPHSGGIERGDDALNDFSQILGFREWVGKQATRSANFLNQNLMQGDIVVTHHLPTYDSVHAAYKGSFLNKYFVHDVSPLLHAGAHLWIHGHTHMSMDYHAGSTRVVCNPFGYLRYEENPKFDERLTIKV